MDKGRGIEIVFFVLMNGGGVSLEESWSWINNRICV